MGKRLRYLLMEIKGTLKLLPRMLLQACLLLGLAGMIVYCGVRSMGREALSVSVDIAVAVREDNVATEMALAYVENLESLSQFCRFRRVTEAEGAKLLKEGQVAALILLPEQLVEGILNGANPSVTVCFPKNAGLEALLFKEMTEAGEGLLRVAQAQIYAVEDTARRFGLEEQAARIEAGIDSTNLAFALDRLALYDAGRVSAFGSMNAVQFYLSSGSVLFLLLSGMAMYPVVQLRPQPFRRQLERQGTGRIWQGFCQWICTVLGMGVPAGMLWAAVRLLTAHGPEAVAARIMTAGGTGTGIRTGIAAMLLVTAATIVYLLHTLAGSGTSGILLVFAVSVVMVFTAGGLVPSLFLPDVVRTVGERLPAARMIRAMNSLLTGQSMAAAGRCAARLCGDTILCGAAACVIRCRKG